jgi:hypothetical protein
MINDELSLALDELINAVTGQFTDLKISKESLYQFVTQKCKISLEQAVERNTPARIEYIYDWILHW